MRITAPGMYPDLDGDVYFDDPCPEPSLRQSLIPRLVKRSPLAAAFRHPRLNPYGDAGESSKVQYFGSAVHRLALGRGREIAIIRYPDWRSSSARQKRDEAIRSKRIPILERDYLRADAAADIVRGRIEEAAGGHKIVTEVPFFWREPTAAGPIWAAGMLDVWIPGLLKVLDPKTTTKEATLDQYERDAAANGYDFQRAWYLRGLNRLALEGLAGMTPEDAGRITFENLVIESDQPHDSALFELDESSTGPVDQLCGLAAERWAQCLAARTWPGYPRKTQRAQTPPYHRNALEGLILENSQ